MDTALAYVVKILSAIAQFVENTELYNLQKRTPIFIVRAIRTMPRNRGKVSDGTLSLGHESWRIIYCWKALQKSRAATQEYLRFEDEGNRKPRKTVLSAWKMVSN